MDLCGWTLSLCCLQLRVSLAGMYLFTYAAVASSSNTTHPPPLLSSLPQPWVFSHAPTECLLLALIRCFIAITFFCRGDYAVVHQERKPHLSWWYTKMFKKGEQTKGPWEGHAIYTIFATSHRNTVITLSSERLYIENKNIIINLSSGMKQRGEVLCRTICTSVLTVNCCI